ncbi:hypothetical protein Tco_1291864 [Tanacetum coccineum]
MDEDCEGVGSTQQIEGQHPNRALKICCGSVKECGDQLEVSQFERCGVRQEWGGSHIKLVDQRLLKGQVGYRRRARSMAKKINTGLDAEDEINTGRVEINSGIEDVNTGSSKVDIGRTSISTSSIIHSPKKGSKEEINTGIEEISTGSTKVDSGTASKRGQREGKALMVEEDIQATHKTKEQMRQEEAGLEEAIKLQAQLDEEVAK